MPCVNSFLRLTSRFVGIQLALLIAERTVVFFRDQDLSPAQQRDLGAYFGEVEVHPSAPQVPGLPGVSIIWDELAANKSSFGFRNPFATQDWHTGKWEQGKTLATLTTSVDSPFFFPFSIVRFDARGSAAGRDSPAQ